MKTAFPIILFLLFSISQNIFAEHIKAVSITLPDGELINYYQHRTLSAKQTSIKGVPKEVLMVRQLTDGTELIQAIYSEGRLVDCDLSSRKLEAKQIESEVKQMMSALYNITYENNNSENNTIVDVNNLLLRNNNNKTIWSIPRRNLPWLNMNRLTRRCLKSHDRTISSVVKSRARRSLLTIKPRRHSRNKMYKSRHDHLAKGKKYRLHQKLISPGTNWCGPSNRALKYGDLGGFWQTDKCCRKHDSCKLSIPAFSNKYSKVNPGPFTLSHCSCDRRFRTCLKMAATGASNLVGKLFFNVVQTKCFVLKPEKICTKRSWWGKCQKYEYRKLAHIRNNLAY